MSSLIYLSKNHRKVRIFDKPYNSSRKFLSPIESCNIVKFPVEKRSHPCAKNQEKKRFQDMSNTEKVVLLAKNLDQLMDCVNTSDQVDIPCICARISLCAQSLGLSQTAHISRSIGENAMAGRIDLAQGDLEVLKVLVGKVARIHFELCWQSESADFIGSD